MKQYNFNNLYRVNKRTAEKLYKAGFEILFIPHKLNPENDFYNLGIWQNQFLEGQYPDFEKLLNAFEYYNCTNETGKYTAFYIKREKITIHFEFADGSNPYIFRGSVLECMEELNRWRENWKIETLSQGFYRLKEV